MIHDQHEAISKALLDPASKLVEKSNGRQYDCNSFVSACRKKRIDQEAFAEARRCAEHKVLACEQRVQRGDLLSMECDSVEFFVGDSIGHHSVPIVRGFLINVVPQSYGARERTENLTI